VRRQLEAARAGEEASAADLESIRLSLQSQLAIVYFQLRVADAGSVILEATLKAFQSSFDVTSNRYRAGVVGKVDVVQSETQLKSVEAQSSTCGPRARSSSTRSRC
jgi:outer membrane protein TolC